MTKKGTTNVMVNATGTKTGSYKKRKDEAAIDDRFDIYLQALGLKEADITGDGNCFSDCMVYGGRLDIQRLVGHPALISTPSGLSSKALPVELWLSDSPLLATMLTLAARRRRREMRKISRIRAAAQNTL
jgi:hypothetical protein